MKNLTKTGTTLFLLLLAFFVHAQTPANVLPSFDKVITSPHVSIVLVAGEQENIQLQYQNIEPEKVNYVVQNKTLSIYLDDARITVKNQKWKEGDMEFTRPIYDKSVKVTAFVTYKSLKSLQIRGEEEATCQSDLTSDSFKLKVYGQATVNLTGLTANKLKVSLFGENKVAIHSGKVARQQYRIYGENTLDTEKLIGELVSVHSYGDSQLNVYASNRIGVMAFGESDIKYAGDGNLRKLVIGEVKIHRAE
ncbi:GIN domain-containing protein [Spirosoma litoris]